MCFINVYDRAADQEVSEILLLKMAYVDALLSYSRTLYTLSVCGEEVLKILLEQLVTEKEMEKL